MSFDASSVENEGKRITMTSKSKEDSKNDITMATASSEFSDIEALAIIQVWTATRGPDEDESLSRAAYVQEINLPRNKLAELIARQKSSNLYETLFSISEPQRNMILSHV
jgi:hypothetical protein